MKWTRLTSMNCTSRKTENTPYCTVGCMEGWSVIFPFYGFLNSLVTYWYIQSQITKTSPSISMTKHTRSYIYSAQLWTPTVQSTACSPKEDNEDPVIHPPTDCRLCTYIHHVYLRQYNSSIIILKEAGQGIAQQELRQEFLKVVLKNYCLQSTGQMMQNKDPLQTSKPEARNEATHWWEWIL